MKTGQLTAAEEQVAEQAAMGRRNEEIAAALGLSPRTVEWHLSKVYRKLHVRSRTELALRIGAAGGPAERRLDKDRRIVEAAAPAAASNPPADPPERRRSP